MCNLEVETMLEKHESMHFPELTRQGIWGAGKWI